MDKDKEIQRLQNLVKALADELIGTYEILKEETSEKDKTSFIEARISALKLLIKTPPNGG